MSFPRALNWYIQLPIWVWLLWNVHFPQVECLATQLGSWCLVFSCQIIFLAVLGTFSYFFFLWHPLILFVDYMCEQADIGSHAHSVLFLFFGGVTYGNLDVQSSMSCFNILCEGYCFSLWILTGTRVPHFWGFATPLCCGHQQFCWCKIPPYTIPCSCRFYGLSHMRVPDQLLDIF